jgi:chemotaxis response regulator CheB
MPRAAVELGVVDRVLPLDHIPHAILHALREQSPAKKTNVTALK